MCVHLLSDADGVSIATPLGRAKLSTHVCWHLNGIHHDHASPSPAAAYSDSGQIVATATIKQRHNVTCCYEVCRLLTTSFSVTGWTAGCGHLAEGPACAVPQCVGASGVTGRQPAAVQCGSCVNRIGCLGVTSPSQWQIQSPEGLPRHCSSTSCIQVCCIQITSTFFQTSHLQGQHGSRHSIFLAVKQLRQHQHVTCLASG